MKYEISKSEKLEPGEIARYLSSNPSRNHHDATWDATHSDKRSRSGSERVWVVVCETGGVPASQLLSDHQIIYLNLKWGVLGVKGLVRDKNSEEFSRRFSLDGAGIWENR
jgi:hypothetical protein